MSRILGYLVAFYALWLSSCLAPLCAASGQLLIQGMLTEASCQLTTRHHPRLAIPLPNSRDNVSQDSHLVTFQLRLSNCGNTLASVRSTSGQRICILITLLRISLTPTLKT